MKSLFKDGLPELPAEVWVICSGLHGRAYIYSKRIPAGACVIGVNRVIEAPVRLTYYVLADRNVIHCDYWHAGIDQGPCRIYAREVADAIGGECCEYVYEQSPALDHRNLAPRYGVLMTGATILGIVLQLCEWAGPPEMLIRLVGADLDGARDFTGNTIEAYRGYDHWAGARRKIEGMLPLMRKGIGVVSMTPTRLKLSGR